MENFNEVQLQNWFEAKGSLYGVTLICIYLLMIPTLTRIMKNKDPPNVKAPMFIWNMLLSVFSALGSYYSIRCFYNLYQKSGIMGPICDTSYYRTKPESFWVAAYSLSKAPEFIDTFFILLKKRKLIFLHWFHHVSVFTYAWFGYPYFYAGFIWYMAMNYTIHAFMYAYYGFSTIGYRLPRSVTWYITMAQILQMLTAFIVQIVILFVRNDDNCPASDINIFGAMFLSGSYFILFARFFSVTYIKQKST